MQEGHGSPRGSTTTVITRARFWRALAAALAVVLAATAGAIYWFLSGDAVRRALERQTSAWLGEPVAIEDARASLFPRIGVRLQGIRVGEPARLVLSQVDVSAPLRALVARRLEDAVVLVSGGEIQMPLPFGIPQRAPAASPPGSTAATGITGGVELVSIRSIALRDVTLVSRGRSVTVTADSSLADGLLTITGLHATSDTTVLTAAGRIALAPRVKATLEASADDLDIDALLALAAAFGSNEGGGPPESPAAEITASVTAARAHVAGVRLERFEAALVAEGANIRVEPLRFRAFGGPLDGWLDVTSGEQLDVRIGLGAANIDMAQLAAFGGAPGSITGRLYGSGRFGARGASMAAALSDFRGVGEAKVSAGTIPNLAIVGTIVRFLGGGEPPSTGGRFDSIEATFALADRELRSDDLTLHAPDYDVLARGTLTLPDQALDVRASLVVSEQLSAQAGRDLYRYTRSGNRIILPAVISGTLSHPSVRIDAGAALERGLRNEIDRRLRDVFERLSR